MIVLSSVHCFHWPQLYSTFLIAQERERAAIVRVTKNTSPKLNCCAIVYNNRVNFPL